MFQPITTPTTANPTAIPVAGVIASLVDYLDLSPFPAVICVLLRSQETKASVFETGLRILAIIAKGTNRQGSKQRGGGKRRGGKEERRGR